MLDFATELAVGLGGQLKTEPEDFEVEEIPAYLPEGEGEHLYIHFEKRGLDTRQAVERLARALGVDPRDAGVAGMKDRHAITRQWASFHRGDASRLEGASLEGVRVLSAARHRNKLRTGHLRGNRFVLRARGARAEAIAPARLALEELERRGVPNYFGDQRFGREGDNRARARAWLVEGGAPPRQPFERKLLVSALQSELFNLLLCERVREGSYGSVIEGDLCRKEDTGGMFVSTDLELDRERAARFEISATGPMFGAEMRWPEGEARAREAQALERAGLTTEHLARFAKWGEGTRRPYRARLRDAELTVEREEAGHADVRVRFELPAGAYATIVMRELMRD